MFVRNSRPIALLILKRRAHRPAHFGTPLRVHTSGFGSYRHLLVICVLQNLVAQVIIVSGIVLAIFTGIDNIYSAPEYAFGSDGKTWLHAGAHLVLGTIAGSLVPWLTGSLILFVTKKMTSDQGGYRGLVPNKKHGV